MKAFGPTGLTQTRSTRDARWENKNASWPQQPRVWRGYAPLGEENASWHPSRGLTCQFSRRAQSMVRLAKTTNTESSTSTPCEGLLVCFTYSIIYIIYSIIHWQTAVAAWSNVTSKHRYFRECTNKTKRTVLDSPEIHPTGVATESLSFQSLGLGVSGCLFWQRATCDQIKEANTLSSGLRCDTLSVTYFKC